MEVEHSKMNNVLVVRPKAKRIDAQNAPDFKAEMVQFIEEGNVNLVINLSAVDLIDSSGLGVMVSMLKRIGFRGEVKLSNVNKDVRALLELTGLDNRFTVYHSEKEAVESFKG